ncbi:MAG: flagellar biosynthetic protein FliO [Terriglobales bacterium]
MATPPTLRKLFRLGQSAATPGVRPDKVASGARAWLGRPTLRRRLRRLKLVETLSLGDRRLVAVLSVDGREFLVGATLHSMSLLGELGQDHGILAAAEDSALGVQ